VFFATAIDALTFAKAAEATFVSAPATLAFSFATVGLTETSMYAGDSTRLAGSTSTGKDAAPTFATNS